MINNNPYNIPEKLPMSQSNISSQTNHSNNGSAYFQNRHEKEMMHSSGIFMKNSTIMPMPINYEQNYYESQKMHLSPHNKYIKTSNVQFVNPTHHIRTNEFSPHNVQPTRIDINVHQKQIQSLKEKMQILIKRIDQKDNNEKQSISKKNRDKNSNNDKLTPSKTDVNKIQDKVQVNIDTLVIFQNFIINSQQQNKKIWQKINRLQQSLKLTSIQLPIENKKTKLDEASVNRLKTIQKFIRQMGQDIHLIHNKQQSNSQRFTIQLGEMKKSLEILSIKQSSKQQKIQKVNKQLEQVTAQLLSMQKSLLSKIVSSCQLLQKKLKSPTIKSSSVARYFNEPTILKYIEKFQVVNVEKRLNQEIPIGELTYYIDHQGYLLDNDRFYLINSANNQRIRLDNRHIDLLKKHRLLI